MTQQTGNVWMVVGAQYGSEGKGKVVSDLVNRVRNPISVRCGGPNSGHTIVWNGWPMVLKAVPSAVTNRDCRLVIPAGAVVDIDLLRKELSELGEDVGARLFIDRRAVLLDGGDHVREGKLRRNDMNTIAGRIGSTGSGNGEALIRRMRRDDRFVRIADQSAELAEMAAVCDTAMVMLDWINRGDDLVIEGNQGYGLSLLHGPHYPYCTSRDVTPAGFLSECGIPPHLLTETVAVMRTFPIRVGGNSGPLENETTWDEVAKIGGWSEKQDEYTSVTKKLRRVGQIDWNWMQRSFRILQPTRLAIMGLDRLNKQDDGATARRELSRESEAFCFQAEAVARGAATPYGREVQCNWFGVGPTDMFTEGLE